MLTNKHRKKIDDYIYMYLYFTLPGRVHLASWGTVIYSMHAFVIIAASAGYAELLPHLRAPLVQTK